MLNVVQYQFLSFTICRKLGTQCSIITNNHQNQTVKNLPIGTFKYFIIHSLIRSRSGQRAKHLIVNRYISIMAVHLGNYF